MSQLLEVLVCDDRWIFAPLEMQQFCTDPWIRKIPLTVEQCAEGGASTATLKPPRV